MSQEYREQKEEDKFLTLRLGDIIEFYAPTNDQLNQQTFFVEYINHSRMVLINIATMEQIQLNRDEGTGELSDKSITQVRLLSRSEHSGYARQNNLLPGTWVEIHIAGDVSIILTGEITSLEEDQIEIRTVPEMDVIYIDFEYKGIPEHIPIKKIVIRDKPAIYFSDGDAEQNAEEQEESKGEDPNVEYLETGEIVIHAQEDAEAEVFVIDALRSEVAKSKEVIFGEDLEDVIQFSEIPESQKRYSIELQTTSLLDELLSTIPSTQRNRQTMQKVRTLIAHYRELRTKFSLFDENGDIKNFKRNNPHLHKPLADSINNLDSKIEWILPVVSVTKKVYLNEETEEGGANDDIAINVFDKVLNEEERTKKNTYYNERVMSDENKYYKLYQQLEDYMRPFENPTQNPHFLASKEVRASMEAIVDNLDEFYSSVLAIDKSQENIIRRRYVIQKYDLGLNKRVLQMRGDRDITETLPLTHPDTMTVKSLVVFPAPVMNYSRVNLPMTSILEKANIHLFPLMIFRILKKNRDIAPFIIEDLEKELYEDDADNFLNELRHYVLSDNIREPDFEKFLKVVIPKTKVLIRIIRKYVVDKLSLVSVVQALEPFKVYNEDITYTQYLDIRRFILEQIAAKKEQIENKRKEIGYFTNNKFDIKPNVLSVIQYLLENPVLLDRLLAGYKMPEREFLQERLTSGEILKRMLEIDNGVLLCRLMSSLMSSLLTPTSLASLFDVEPEEDRDFSIKAADCNKRVLTKRYSSIAELQKDNGGEDIFYDKEFDETPYHIMEKYKDEKKKMLPDKFLRFLVENLIEKHDCPKNMADSLALILISGKKPVKEGEFAMLVLKPHHKEDVKALSLEERRKIEDEANIRAITSYYYRKNDTWIPYNDIDEDAFVDTTQLFCNLKETCSSSESVSGTICESDGQVVKRIREGAKKKIKGEFDTRFELSYEDMKSTMEREIAVQLRHLDKWLRIQSIVLERPNNIAHEIGLQATGYADAVISPHLGLRDRILGQSDFVKKQNDIARFYDKFCREPLEFLEEDNGWKYCKESNTKLLPAFLLELATSFVNGGDYQLKLEELCHTHGLMSDAGNAIVDKHSGFVVRAIDFAEEDAYDEAGFKVTTHAFIEKGEADKAVENLMKTYSGLNEKTICESARNQMICNLLDAMSKQIPLMTVQEYCIRVAATLCDSLIDPEDKYVKAAKKMEEKKGIKLPPYKKRVHQLTILITAAAFFTAIQTETPAFNTKKTMPGCVKSFRGFPLDGEEDLSGIKYMACVLSKMEKKIEPWNSIDRLTVAMMEDQLKKILISAVQLAEVDERYLKKREYMMVNFEEPIPQDHALEKWLHFLPPLVDTNIGARSIAADFKDDFISLMKKGRPEQHKDYMVLKSKAAAFAIEIIENIQKIVQGKELLLTAISNGQPFLQNVCCNERDRDHIPIMYFAKEKEEIARDIRTVANLSALLESVVVISKAPILFDPRDSYLKYPSISADIIEQNIYAAFIHYCQLDKGVGVPIKFHGFLTDIPGGYPASGTIYEKIDFLKRNNKRFSPEQLLELMRIVNGENRVNLKTTEKYNISEILKDLVLLFDDHASPVIDKDVRENIYRVLVKYDKTKLMAIVDEPENSLPEGEKGKIDAIKTLKNGLAEMLEGTFKPSVLSFLKKYGKIGARDYNLLESFFGSIVRKWASPDLYKVSNFIKNAVDEMTRIFPNILLNNSSNISPIHSYWGLAMVDSAKIYRSIQAYYEPLGEFREDIVIRKLIFIIQEKFVDLRLFFENLPIQKSIRIGSRDYFSLFDTDTIELLLEYVFLSVLHEYIIATDDENLIRLDSVEKRAANRARSAEQDNEDDIESEYVDLDEEYQEAYGDMAEVQIQAGNQEELKTRVAKLLIAFINIVRKNKSEIDISYDNISAAIRKRKEKEKNRIVERFKAMSPDERAVEDMKKKYKMDEWNVGTQRGIFEYDKKTSEREVREQDAEEALDIQKHGMRKADFISIHGDNEEGEEALRDNIDVADMQTDLDEAEDNENLATGMAGLKSNFFDGQFYSDDESDDDFGED